MNVFYAEAGESIYNAIRRCQLLLIRSNMTFGYLTFNDIRLRFSAHSEVDDVAAIYNLKHRLRQLGEEV